MSPAGAGGKHQETVIDGLRTLIPEIAKLKVATDAQQHMQFVQALEQGVMRYIQQDAAKQAQQQAQVASQATGMGLGGGVPGMGGAGGLGGGPPGGMGGQMGMQPGGGAGMAGLSATGGQGPNPDELRRMMAGPAMAQGG